MEKGFSTRPGVSAAGGFSLVHPDGAARKARSVKISRLAHALAGQNGRQPGFTGLTALDPSLHALTCAARERFAPYASLQ